MLREAETSVAPTQTEAPVHTIAAGRASPREAARAFGVVVGPSVVLDALVATSVASAVRAVRGHRHPGRTAALVSALARAYAPGGGAVMAAGGRAVGGLAKAAAGRRAGPGPRGPVHPRG